MSPKSRTRILAIASGGGHWVQLMRLRPALSRDAVTYVSVSAQGRHDLDGERLHVINDATRWNRLGLLVMAARILWIVLRERPKVVISTGAAPGFFGLLFGKVIGARTIWVDSFANVEEMSLSGRKVRRYADLWLTQWPSLATSDGPVWAGAVL